MARRWTALTVAAACLAFAAAAADAGPPDIFVNDYEGRAERDPNTYFGFDVTKREGVRKVGKVSALLPYTCRSGDSFDAAGRVNGKLRVDDEGRFAGTLRGDPLPFRAAHRGAPPRLKYRVQGRLLGGGRAKGRIDATLTFSPTLRGEPIVCYTGRLDWKAKRGADVVLPPF